MRDKSIGRSNSKIVGLAIVEIVFVKRYANIRRIGYLSRQDKF